jgi:predicted Zn-dependent protease
MKNNLLPLILLVSLALPHESHSNIQLRQHTPNTHEQYYFLALKGAHDHVTGRYQNARDTYTYLHQVTPEDTALMSAAIRLAFDNNNFAEVIAYADKIDLTQSSNKELAFLIAQAYLFLNKDHDGIALLETLRKHYPHDDRFDYFAAIAYTKTTDNQTAQKIIDAVLADSTKRTRHYLFHFLKAKYLFTSNQLDAALHEVTESLINNTSFAKGFFLKGAILEQQHAYTRALAAYKRYQALTKNDPAVAEKIEALRTRITLQELEAEPSSLPPLR